MVTPSGDVGITEPSALIRNFLDTTQAMEIKTGAQASRRVGVQNHDRKRDGASLHSKASMSKPRPKK